MKNSIFQKLLFCFTILFALCQDTQAQQVAKIVAECTITYSVNLQGNMNEQTTKKLYIKGRKTRSEISNAAFNQATIYDNKTGEAIVLKEIGGDKYISFFDEKQWKDKNSGWTDAVVNLTGETKKILTYNCRKAVVTLKSGGGFIVYFTADLAASANENPYQFKNIPGLILGYESKGKKEDNIELKATDINFSPVPAAKFTVPATGYRIIKQ